MVIGNSYVLFMIYMLGQVFYVCLFVVGINFMIFVVKVWVEGQMEFVGWQFQGIDIIVVMQVVGGVGIKMLISLVLINVVIKFLFECFVVVVFQQGIDEKGGGVVMVLFFFVLLC